MHAPLDAGISLRSSLPEGQLFGAAAQGGDIRFHTLCSDSRRVREGDLFVALIGRRDDGHNHIRQAVERGAAAVLTERPLPLGVPQYVVPDTRIAHATLCLELAGRPQQQLHVTGVAGTAGKTVTSLLLANIMASAGRRVGLTGSLGYSDSLDQCPAVETTPRAPQIATWLGRMVENECQEAVIELDSLALADRRAGAVPLRTAVLTNLHRPQLRLHEESLSFASYCRRKQRLFEQLLPGGVAILNADDEACMAMANRLECGVLTFGFCEDADVNAMVLERNRGEQLFLLTVGSESVPVRTRMLGDFHVQNCLAATAAALAMELPLEAIVRGLEGLEHVPGRLSRIVAGQSCGVFLDASRDPHAITHNLSALRQVTPGRLFCVLGADSCDDEHHAAARGRAVERGADHAVICGPTPGKRASLQSLHDVLDGFQNPVNARLLPSRDSAIDWVLRAAKPEDTVLIAGSHGEEHSLVEGLLRSHDAVAPSVDDEGPVIYRIEDYRQ
ncbi:MAG: UDP-N-acetylmuramyl-tripeptide synthetase [Planctomycetales bacterium]|nr:UDP-N-acetylmuramyl-tripeptide synthetase [Planctomycetales bacterium]